MRLRSEERRGSAHPLYTVAVTWSTRDVDREDFQMDLTADRGVARFRQRVHEPGQAWVRASRTNAVSGPGELSRPRT